VYRARGRTFVREGVGGSDVVDQWVGLAVDAAVARGALGYERQIWLVSAADVEDSEIAAVRKCAFHLAANRN
jgi:hypothetical protein